MVSPLPLKRPTVKPVKLPDVFSVIFFDLETTGFALLAIFSVSILISETFPDFFLGGTADIIQVGAVCSDESTFNQYAIPNQPITSMAQSITKLTYIDGILYYDEKKVDAVPIEQCLKDFLSYIKSKNKPLLLGHNIKRYDIPILTYHLIRFGMYETFLENILGFIDTLPLCKILFPDRKSYQQDNLVRDILKVEYGAHNALEDVIALNKLVYKGTPSLNAFEDLTFSALYAKEIYVYNDQKKKNFGSLEYLVWTKKMTKYMANKIAGSGLNWKDLLKAYKEDQENGIEKLFKELVDGRARVTNSKEVIEKLNRSLEELCTPK